MRGGIDPGRLVFSFDSHYHVSGHASIGDDRIDMFALWMLDDIQGGAAELAQLADSIGRHMIAPDEEADEFGGNAWFATITHDGIDLENHFVESNRVFLSLADAAALLKVYWDHIRSVKRPDRFDKQARKFANRAQREPVLPWEIGSQ